MENGETLLLVLDLAGLGFLAFYAWHVLVKKNDPGVVGLSLSAIVSVHLIGSILEFVAG